METKTNNNKDTDNDNGNEFDKIFLDLNTTNKSIVKNTKDITTKNKVNRESKSKKSKKQSKTQTKKQPKKQIKKQIKKHSEIYTSKTKNKINDYFKKIISIKTRDYSPYRILVNKIIETNKTEWDFKSNSEYTQILENLGKYYGNLYLEQLKKQFPKFFYKNKKYLIDVCEMNDLYGKPKLRPFTSFIPCSSTNLRYILHSLLILTFMTNHKLNNIDIIEIGGGYGGLSLFMHKISPLFKINIKSYTIIDLPEISLLQKTYLDALDMSKNMHFYNINNYKNLKKNSFLISNYAYSEIAIELQQEYTEKILNPYISYGFLVWNYIEIYDFIKSKIILKEYEEPDTSHNNTNFYVTILPREKLQSGKINRNIYKIKIKNKNKNKKKLKQKQKYKKYTKKF